MKEIATQIEARFSEMGVEVQLSEIEAELDRWINKFKVLPDEARKHVFNFFLKEHNTTKTVEYPKNWNLLKQIVYEKANYKCQYCGKRGMGLNAHHLKHLSEGGSNDLDNLVCVCDECHSIIHYKNKELRYKYENNLKNKNFETRYKLFLN